MLIWDRLLFGTLEHAVSALYFRPSENLPDFVTITMDQDS